MKLSILLGNIIGWILSLYLCSYFIISKLYFIEINKSLERIPECWICYDPEKPDCGPLIQPCKCRGDVSVVHHECLKQWLIEVSTLSFMPYQLFVLMFCIFFFVLNENKTIWMCDTLAYKSMQLFYLLFDILSWHRQFLH